MEKYNSAQARYMLRVDAKTFLLWIKKAGITPEVSKADNRVKLFTREQLEQLSTEHERPLQPFPQPPEPEQDILTRLDALEQQVHALQWQIEALSLQPTHKPSHPRQAPSASSVPHAGPSTGIVWLSDSLVAWRSFVRVHHVAESAASKRIRKGDIPTIEGHWQIKNTKYQEAWNEDGRRRFHEVYRLPLPCALCGMD